MPNRTGPNFRDVSKILSPQSIAIVGASDQPGNLGGVAVGLLGKFGYRGDVWPVNPKRDTVGGRPCYPAVGALPRPADMAILATPAGAIPGLIAECAAAGIGSGIVWAGGFAEVGPEGAAAQDLLDAACREHDFTLMGPNCIGVVNVHERMVASFASFLDETDELLAGDISMVSQSGGLATMVQALTQRAGFGFRHMISSGNEVAIDVADYANALVDDPATRVIALYLEGVRDGERLLAVLDRARAANKPVVILKGGASEASARAAAAHTGAMVGEGRVWDAVLRARGVIQAQSLEQLVDLLAFLSALPPGRTATADGLAAVSFGGGCGVVSADQCARNGLAMPLLAPATTEALRPLVPPIAAIANPVDLTPQTYNQERWFETFPAALDAIAADPGIGVVLLQFGPMAQRGMEVARAAKAFQDRTDKVVCLAWPLAPRGAVPYLRAEGLHVFEDYGRAIEMLGRLMPHWRHARTPAAAPAAVAAFDWHGHLPSPQPGTILSEDAAHALLAAAGIEVAQGRLVSTAAELDAALAAIGVPVAMKGISPQVTHRAAADLLALGIADAETAERRYAEIVARAEAAGIALDGVYLQRMIPGRLEIFVSAFRDPVFGVMVSVGAGGNLAEAIDDLTLEQAPFDAARAEAVIGRLRIAGKAGMVDPSADPKVLADFLSRFSRLAAGCPWREFVIEVNPVKWSGAGVAAVDGLVVIGQP